MTEDTELPGAMTSSFSRHFQSCARQTRALCADLSEEEFWARPYPYGNSVGHLVLHITGNLNHFIGTRIAGTGYVRNRELEFTDTSRRPKDMVLGELDRAVNMVVGTVGGQSAGDWVRVYDGVEGGDPTRFSILLRCAAHFHHHVGQVIYLVKEHVRLRQGS
jgi:uncharacterized damage-inducible protein DinB